MKHIKLFEKFFIDSEMGESTIGDDIKDVFQDLEDNEINDIDFSIGYNGPPYDRIQVHIRTKLKESDINSFLQKLNPPIRRLEKMKIPILNIKKDDPLFVQYIREGYNISNNIFYKTYGSYDPGIGPTIFRIFFDIPKD